MLYVKIDENQQPVGEPVSEAVLRQSLGENVSLPNPIKDIHINALGYGCVGETYTSLKIDKTTLLRPVVVPQENGDTLFTREWELTPYPGDIEERVRVKWKEVRQKRDRLLAETDFAASDDYFYMKDQYIAYRNALRDLSDQTDDPFLVVFPTPPHNPASDRTLEGRKAYASYKNEELFMRSIKQGSVVKTPHGFSVWSSEDNYRLIKGSLEMGLNLLYDLENVRRSLSADQMKDVVTSIEQANQRLFERKKGFERAIAEADDTSIGTVIADIKRGMGKG